MKSLPKGANALLTTSGRVRVAIRWPIGRLEVDAVCFAVTDAGRVPGDEWFLFYNQREAPGRGIELAASGIQQSDFVVHLDRLPATVQRCVFAATLDEGTFRAAIGTRLTAMADKGETLEYKLVEAGDEQALILAEIYRHGTGWRLRAIGQGFRGGLQPLAEHFGVKVREASPVPDRSGAAAEAESPRVPPTGGAEPPATPPAEGPSSPPPGPERRRHGSRIGVWAAAAVVVALAGLLLWFLVAPLVERLADDRSELPEPSQPVTARYEPPTCAWSDDEVFERYHALGESYIQILQRVDQSNERLARVRQDLIGLEGRCAADFLDKNRHEIEALERLPVGGWLDQALRLNVCAGLLIKAIETALDGEGRPIIIQRLVREADRARNLESDLTNISRDLAYLRNKTERLKLGYHENLEACLE
ncbi:TerD family protein [Thioalkalicoccus limnaeus]|uniref:TerD family protein n=1 Tax=Thioalkalicoccus limnaeus TaxID=120681 RepID=A0ABV4BCN9_9GAMM